MLFGDLVLPTNTPGLVGIAKLAAESEVLESKRVVRYFEIQSKSLLNRTRPGMPFEWSLNPYRGCEFGCQYCYARYTHEFMELRESVEFEDKIYAKSGIAQILRRELKRMDGRGGIAIGTATDPYQPAERRFKRTQAALEVFSLAAGHRAFENENVRTYSSFALYSPTLVFQCSRVEANGQNRFFRPG